MSDSSIQNIGEHRWTLRRQLELMSKLPGLMSRWRMLAECKYFSPTTHSTTSTTHPQFSADGTRGCQLWQTVTSVTQSDQLKLRWSFIPDFPRQSRFSTTCPGKKSQLSPDAHFSCFWLGVPDLSRYWQTALFHCTNTNIYMLEKKSLAGGAVPRTPLWKLTMLSQSPKLHPRRLANVALAPYVRIAVPKLWPP